MADPYGGQAASFNSTLSPARVARVMSIVQAELVPVAAHQIGDVRLPDPESLRRLRLSPTMLLYQESQARHEVGPHRQDGCFFGREAEIEKHIAESPVMRMSSSCMTQPPILW